MISRYFRPIRIAVSFTFLTVIALCFIDVHGLVPSDIIGNILYFQFMPALMQGIAIGAVSGAVIIVLGITLVAGRLYCSFLCPLGAFMDLALGVKPGKKHFQWKAGRHLSRRLPFRIMRIFFLIAGFIAIDFFDPFSIFGRFMAVLVRPPLGMANNGFSELLEKIGVYTIPPVNIRYPAWPVTVLVLVYLCVILAMTLKKKRLYCNSVCPVGTLLGLVARLSFYRVSIDSQSCSGCRACERVCKAWCIDSRNYEVDTCRCVGCGDCLSICPAQSIAYRPFWSAPGKPPGSIDGTRRRLTGLLLVCFLSASRKLMAKITAPLVYVRNRTPVIRHHAITPPGSTGIDHFIDACTACYLCVARCPGQVLQPALAPMGKRGLLLPRFDNSKGFCNDTCTSCGEVCPTGAIRPLTLQEKKKIQVGKAQFIRENCIVVTQKTACGACSEHCPTKAVSMVPEQGLLIPSIDTSICVGCGACEYACPSLPHKSIYVEGNPVHLRAENPQPRQAVMPESPSDFPF